MVQGKSHRELSDKRGTGDEEGAISIAFDPLHGLTFDGPMFPFLHDSPGSQGSFHPGMKQLYREKSLRMKSRPLWTIHALRQALDHHGTFRTFPQC